MMYPSLFESTVGRISTQHRWAAGANAISRNALTSVAVSTAWPTANKAFHVPLFLPEYFRCNRFFTLNGATASGNIDIGIYNEFDALIASTGSTAQAGTNAVQNVSVTEFILRPGFYRLALALSSATGTIFATPFVNTDNASPYDLTGEASALPLPATATPINQTTGFFLPVFGIVATGIV